MKALWKTLVGDSTNLGVVALLVATTSLLARTGHADVAAFAVPALALAGVTWLAAR